MKVVEYDRSLQWVGDVKCPKCNGLTPAWRSSGMSECFPHFFCDTCSNVIQRESDKKIVWHDKSQEALEKIAKTLPKCSCGGQFAPSCGPKCKHCNTEIPIVRDAVEYLHNPNMIVVDGACTFSDKREDYMVRIVEAPTPQHNKPINRTKKTWLRSCFAKIAKLF
ncbi:hypothetical protein [Photobacterium leiognathi]|uniref:hypothetical protein n=1 Tax=Photobacterium leiognathi TaxID=553611 RepID=UPI0029814EAC|nr:hypothetical protein [Photobacterium leiognathi]